MKIIVIGDVMLDVYKHVEVKRLSPEAPVPCGEIVRTEERLGGAANVAHNIKVLCPEAEVGLVGAVGMDYASGVMFRKLDRAGVVDYLVRDEVFHTVTKTRYVDLSGHHLLRIDDDSSWRNGHPSNTPFTWSEETLASVADADLIVISDYAKGTVPPIELALNQPLFVNCKPGDVDHYLQRQVDCLVLNEAEALAYDTTKIVGGFKPDWEVAARCMSKFASNVVVTRGSKGLFWFKQRLDNATCEPDIHEVPAVPVLVSDVCGAGDTLLASLAVSYARSGVLTYESMERAVQDAANVVNQLGTSVPRKQK